MAILEAQAGSNGLRFFSSAREAGVGGPACGLWIPADSGALAVSAVDRMIRAVGRPSESQELAFSNDPRGRRARRHWERTRRQDEAPRAGDFDVMDTRPIGGRLYELWSPMYCSWPGRWRGDGRDEDDDADVRAAFGLPGPLATWSLGTYVNSGDSHRALADVAAYLTEQTGGVIDFHVHLPAAAELPGRAVTIGGGVPGRPRRTFLDAVAMRAWSQRQDCRMCK